jgi:hypothetical protein
VPRSPHDPNLSLNAGKTCPAVWGTYREAYELYRLETTEPAAFASAAATNTVCGPSTPGTEILPMATKSRTNAAIVAGQIIGNPPGMPPPFDPFPKPSPMPSRPG